MKKILQVNIITTQGVIEHKTNGFDRNNPPTIPCNEIRMEKRFINEEPVDHYVGYLYASAKIPGTPRQEEVVWTINCLVPCQVIYSSEFTQEPSFPEQRRILWQEKVMNKKVEKLEKGEAMDDLKEASAKEESTPKALSDDIASAEIQQRGKDAQAAAFMKKITKW